MVTSVTACGSLMKPYASPNPSTSTTTATGSTVQSRHLRVHVRERFVIENSCRRITYLLHRNPHAARLLIDTLVTLHVRRLTDARHGCKRPLQHANHLAKRNLGGASAEEVPPTLPFLALDDPVTLELEEN